MCLPFWMLSFDPPPAPPPNIRPVRSRLSRLLMLGGGAGNAKIVHLRGLMMHATAGDLTQNLGKTGQKVRAMLGVISRPVRRSWPQRPLSDRQALSRSIEAASELAYALDVQQAAERSTSRCCSPGGRCLWAYVRDADQWSKFSVHEVSSGATVASLPVLASSVS